MRPLLHAAAVLAAVVFIPSATAQDLPFNAYSVPDYALNASINRYAGMVARGILFPQASRAQRTQADKARRSTFTPVAAAGDAARAMAAAAPPPRRAELAQLLGSCLSEYRKVETRFKIPANDVASGAAAFLAGSYMAYHGVDFPDQAFPPLVAQIRAVLQQDAAFALANNVARQRMYEEMASVGMVMALSQMALKQRPDEAGATALRAAAGSYLAQFLGTSADKLVLTPRGLALR